MPTYIFLIFIGIIITLSNLWHICGESFIVKADNIISFPYPFNSLYSFLIAIVKVKSLCNQRKSQNAWHSVVQWWIIIMALTPMRTICLLVEMSVMPFIEPIRSIIRSMYLILIEMLWLVTHLNPVGSMHSNSQNMKRENLECSIWYQLISF